MENNIKEIFNIPSINPDRNYWMIRTNSGKFLNGEPISTDQITQAKISDKESSKKTKKSVK